MIAVLTSSYPADDQDYRGRFVADLVEELAARIGPVEVLAPVASRGAPPTHRGPVRLRELGDFGGLFGGAGMLANVRARPRRALALPQALRAMGRALDDVAPRPRLYVGQWLLPSGWVLAQRRHRAVPAWVVCHSGGVRMFATLPAPIRAAMARRLAARIDHLTFVSAALREDFLAACGTARRRLASRCSLLPMGVRSARFADVRRDPRGPVACVARLTPLKAVHRLIEAAARHGGRLRLVGDGPERPRLEALAARRGVTIELRGALPPAEIPAALDGCSALALPSRRLPNGRREGLPLTVLEGLAAGLPVLVTRSWELPTTLAALPGVLRCDDDDVAFAEAYARLRATALTEEPEPAALRRAGVAAFADWEVVGARAAELAQALITGRTVAARGWP